MLDCFEIVSTSGVVLWSKNYAPTGNNVINSLIRDIFIEERAVAVTHEDSAQKPSYRKDGYTLKWATAKDLGLIFVAVYQSIIQLTWIDKLIDNVRVLFMELYRKDLKANKPASYSFNFDPYFDRQVEELEKQYGGATTNAASSTSNSVAELTPPSSSGHDDPPVPILPSLKQLQQSTPRINEPTTSNDDTPSNSRPSSPAAHLLQAKNRPTSRRGRKAASYTPAPASSGDESSGKQPKKGEKSKRARKWDSAGMADEDDDVQLDYSQVSETDTAKDIAIASQINQISQSDWGQHTRQGQFVLKDLDEEMDKILAQSKSKKAASGGEAAESSGLVGSGLGAITGLFRNVVGGKTLTKEDLQKPLKGMEDHLLKKNVAFEAAQRLCESVEQDLVGKKTESFTSIEATLRQSMEKALTKIMTPTSSLDLLHEIESVARPSSRFLSSSTKQARPYVLSIVGVNGVGKSTNLSKIAYFLLQNQYRVLICAADTFRSGAVEQLRVHVRNLKELVAREGGGADVDIFERGYGKDAGNIAAEAVGFAAREGYQVVLIDTAGRRHNDQRLMSSLESFAKKANPDKILMVGEALVGSDSVQQARHFNESFGKGRGLNGFVISKCDTVGDMVGVIVSMVHATGIPVVFLGVGQHYGDLRGLSVSWAVRLLMQ